MLPLYSPELNPLENLRGKPREESLHNCVFDSLDALENHLEAETRDMVTDREYIQLYLIYRCMALDYKYIHEIEIELHKPLPPPGMDAPFVPKLSSRQLISSLNR
jgi:hypothetical protein